MFGFALLAVVAYLAFFVFVVNTVLGRVVSCLLGLASLGLAARQFARPTWRAQLLQTDVWLPIWLLFLYTASCLWVLFLHGGEPETSMSHLMPPDNILPRVLADLFWNGGPVQPFRGIPLLRVNPFFGDWLSSDRPPLQAALYLFCRPFELLTFDHNDVYRIVSTLCQTLWLPAVYLLARGLHFSRYAMGLMLVWFAGNGFLLFQSVYTWPKLLSAALFLTGLSILLFCAENLPKRYPVALMALGLFWGLAMLSHGGILFSLLAVPFLPSAWRLVRADAPSVLRALAVFILVGLPWSAYQKFYDPPGNRLVKWHLAGVIPIDSRGTLATLRDSYGKLTLAQWWQNREGNLESSLLWSDPQAAGAFQAKGAMQTYLNEQVFYRVSAAVGLLSIGFIGLVVAWLPGKRSRPLMVSGWGGLFLMNIASYLIWITLMFSPTTAVVHQGSYAMIVLFMMIGALGLAELPIWLGLLLLVIQWAFFGFTSLYFFTDPITCDASWLMGQVLYWLLTLLFALSVCALLPEDSRAQDSSTPVDRL